ncbi:MAG: transcriptional repressor [Pseudonocardiales bacterium]|nr:transcriptional repressor [Pseudonocardiales bacterium]MBV9029758.1 transcriptional repressor [Pseudonocardiales bacterium]
MISSDIGHQLRQAGLRVTAPRQAVLHWLAEHPHATVEQIRSGVAPRLGSVSTQTVYDVPAACTAAGLVRRIEPAGHPARLERRTGDDHHHVGCRPCGRTEDVDCAANVRPCLTPSDDHGYLLDEAELVFWGSCPSCQNPAARTPVAGVPDHDRPDYRQNTVHHHQEAPQ